MIGGIVGYTHVSARARAMAGALITDQQWRQLLDTPDLSSFVHALEGMRHGQDLTLPEPLSLPQLELAFVARLARHHERFIALLGGAARQLLRELWRGFELDNLKALLRGLVSGREVRAESLVVPLRGSVLPVARLREVGDLAAMASLLADTVYGPPLADALPRYQSEGTLFAVEVALDLSHWRRLWTAVTHLSGTDQQWARRLVGSQMDAANITWAFRYRIYYDLSEVEIINYTLPYGYRSDDAILRAIAAGATVPEVVERVWGETAPELQGLEGGDVREALQALELALARLCYRLAWQPFATSPFHLGIVLGYLMLKGFEARDLTTLAESKPLALAPQEVEPYLIGLRS